MTDQHIMGDVTKDGTISESQKQLAMRQRKEPWGKVLLNLGREPYHTESSARQVAEYAAEVEAERNALRRDLQRADARLLLYERYLADCVGAECCRRQARIKELEAQVYQLSVEDSQHTSADVDHIEVDRSHASAATTRLGAVLHTMTNADRDAVHRFLSKWREELGINNPTLTVKCCVNCTSNDLVPAPPELRSNRALKCNRCGYLQD